MPIPHLTANGLIPEGKHHVTRAEVEAFYCSNPNRANIWNGYLSFVTDELLPKGLHLVPVFLDGGFTSKKAITKDIDIVLDCSNLSKSDLLDVWAWHASDHDRIVEKYKVDFWISHPALPNDLSAFFSYINPKDRIQMGVTNDLRKGLLVIHNE